MILRPKKLDKPIDDLLVIVMKDRYQETPKRVSTAPQTKLHYIAYDEPPGLIFELENHVFL